MTADLFLGLGRLVLSVTDELTPLRFLLQRGKKSFHFCKMTRSAIFQALTYVLFLSALVFFLIEKSAVCALSVGLLTKLDDFHMALVAN